MILYEEIPVDVFASVGKYIQDNLTSYPIFYEGSEARRDVSDEPVKGIEIRFNGPEVSPLTKVESLIKVSLDLLITSPITDDLFEIHRMVGACVKVLKTSIPVNGVNNGYLGCLHLVDRRRRDEVIEIQHYGQIDENKAVLQASVAADYQLIICEE